MIWFQFDFSFSLAANDELHVVPRVRLRAFSPNCDCSERHYRVTIVTSCFFSIVFPRNSIFLFHPVLFAESSFYSIFRLFNFRRAALISSLKLTINSILTIIYPCFSSNRFIRLIQQINLRKSLTIRLCF